MTTDRDRSRDETGTPNDDLADRVDDLESAIRDLRRRTMRPPRGPLGLPRPLTPREFVEFTDRHAIPATVAFLEANIRALEALQAALRVVRSADDTAEHTRQARERTAELGAKTLDALDRALDDLRDAYREGALPNDQQARSVLQDAQRLTDEIRDELAAAREPWTDDLPTRGRETRDRRVDPDEVETELEVLRDEFDEDEAGASPDDGGDGENEDDAPPQ